MKNTGITRRDFLKISGAAGSALATAPLHPALKFLSPSVRIGAILPETSRHPLLSKSFLDGIQLYSREHGTRAAISVETVGVSRQSAVKAATNLVDQEVDVVVGFIGTPAVQAVRPIFEEKKARLIACNAGENVLRAADLSHNIYHNSLNLWQANWSAGQWSVDQYGKRGMIISAFRESGYDLLYTFELGVKSAGGQIEESFITHVSPENDRLDAAIDLIRRIQPDFIYAAFSGQEGEAFISAYRGLNIPVIGTAFMPHTEAPTSWVRNFNSDENRRFTKAFERFTGREADLFAVLGYETAQLVASPGQTEFFSPRGMIVLDGQRVKSPLYLQNSRGSYQVLNFPSEQEITAQVENGSPKTGWVTPYLVY